MPQQRLTMTDKRRAVVGLPLRDFLYTLDQVGYMIGMSEAQLKSHVYFWGRSVGRRERKKLLARNIAPEGEKPVWRIGEQEYIRWLRACGFRVLERAWLEHDDEGPEPGPDTL